MTPKERATALSAIANEVRDCSRCRLSATRTNAVPGEGSPDTEVVFVGEGPGQNEDQQGRPFVGAAGALLTELIGAIGWRREEVFITNVVKCRPPGNRDPEPDEIAACAPFLRRQLDVLDPALVVTLGRHSLGTFMPGARIGQVHGTVRAIDPGTGARSALALAMYHPAAAFRQLSLKETMREDMSRVPGALIEARALRAARVSSAPPAPSGLAAPGSAPGSRVAEPGLEQTGLEQTGLEQTGLEQTAAATPDAPEPGMPAEHPADDLVEALAAIDMRAIPTEPPPETDQMRLF